MNVAKSNRRQKRLDHAAMFSMIIGIALAPFTFGASATVGVNLAVALGTASNAMKINETRSEYRQGMISKTTEKTIIGISAVGIAFTSLGSVDTAGNLLKDAGTMLRGRMTGSVANDARLVSDVTDRMSLTDKLISDNAELSREATRTMEEVGPGHWQFEDNERHGFSVKTDEDVDRNPLLKRPTEPEPQGPSTAENMWEGYKSRMKSIGRLRRREFGYGGDYGGDSMFFNGKLEKIAQVGIITNTILSADYNQNFGQIGQKFKGKRDMLYELGPLVSTTGSEFKSGGVGISTAAAVGTAIAGALDDFIFL